LARDFFDDSPINLLESQACRKSVDSDGAQSWLRKLRAEVAILGHSHVGGPARVGRCEIRRCKLTVKASEPIDGPHAFEEF